MKRIASPGSMHDTGCLGLVHWDDPEEGFLNSVHLSKNGDYGNFSKIFPRLNCLEVSGLIQLTHFKIKHKRQK